MWKRRENSDYRMLKKTKGKKTTGKLGYKAGPRGLKRGRMFDSRADLTCQKGSGDSTRGRLEVETKISTGHGRTVRTRTSIQVSSAEKVLGYKKKSRTLEKGSIKQELYVERRVFVG